MDRRAARGGLAAPAPTVLSSNCLMWAKAGGDTLCTFSMAEHCAIMTFPPSYRFPLHDRTLFQRLCGNTVPPQFARHLMSDYRLPSEKAGLPPARFPPRPPSPCANM